MSLVRDRNKKVIQVTISETVLGLKLFCPKRASKCFRKIVRAKKLCHFPSIIVLGSFRKLFRVTFPSERPDAWAILIILAKLFNE